MAQIILNIEDQGLEAALNEIAQEERKSITDVILNGLQYFITQKHSISIKNIDKELQANLDTILASEEETDYVRNNPILRTKVDNGLRAFANGEGFTVLPEQLGIKVVD